MIFTLNILIDLCLIWVAWKNYKRIKFMESLSMSYALDIDSHEYSIKHLLKRVPKVDYSKINGQLEKAQRRAAIAEKLAERAFSLANTATLGVVSLSKTLPVRHRYANKEDLKTNELAKDAISSAYQREWGVKLEPELHTYDEFLDDSEKEILKNAQNYDQKFNGMKS